MMFNYDEHQERIREQIHRGQRAHFNDRFSTKLLGTQIAALNWLPLDAIWDGRLGDSINIRPEEST